MATQKKRTSKKQFQIYLGYLCENEILKSGKLTPNVHPGQLDELWEDMKMSLNSCGDGPLRTVQEWKKIFTEWKSTVRKKAREGKMLADHEVRLIDLTGQVAVSGMQVQELGGTNKAQVGCIYDEDFHIDDDQENVEYEEILIVEEDKDVREGIGAASAQPPQPQPAKQKKRTYKSTGDVLTDAYTKAVSEQANSLNRIGDGIFEVAHAINRYCEILEKRTK